VAWPAARRPIARGGTGRQIARNETLKRGVQSLGIQDRLERYQMFFRWCG